VEPNAGGVRRRIPGRTTLVKLVAAVGIVGALGGGVARQALATQSRAPGRFTLASIESDYAYTNHLSNVASYGVFRFDGRGGVRTDGIRVNQECLTCEGNRKVFGLGAGVGSYQVNADGTGSMTIMYRETSPATGKPYTYTYEFVVTTAADLGGGRRLALTLFSAGTTGGLAGQLFAPVLTRQLVPRGAAGR